MSTSREVRAVPAWISGRHVPLPADKNCYPQEVNVAPVFLKVIDNYVSYVSVVVGFFLPFVHFLRKRSKG